MAGKHFSAFPKAVCGGLGRGEGLGSFNRLSSHQVCGPAEEEEKRAWEAGGCGLVLGVWVPEVVKKIQI